MFGCPLRGRLSSNGSRADSRIPVEPTSGLNGRRWSPTPVTRRPEDGDRALIVAAWDGWRLGQLSGGRPQRQSASCDCGAAGGRDWGWTVVVGY